ncbi:hypothetical protein [Demequina silvatica]|uniref:hypothetical protein n=1 Tax=Demequina silvatica TaxID=1638988 RepID=UPI000784FDF6|nr:hypothetical protein [Demequina silvatica]
MSRPGERVYGALSEESENLRAEFLASDDAPYGPGKCAGCALDLILGFAEVVSLGGPMLWDARVVGHLVRVWAPGIVKDCGALEEMPTVLAGFVRFMHRREDVDPLTSQEVARTIHEAVRDGRGTVMRRGTAPVDPWLREEELRDYRDRARDALAAFVGGPEALEALDTEPLPDEEFRWEGIAEDIFATVAQYLSLLDGVADEHLDVEHRTAMRRLLARIALADPRVFRRSSSVVRGAAAVALVVCEANDTIASRRQGANVAVLAGWFGTDGGVADRARIYERAIGAPSTASYGFKWTPPALGSADLLISARRAAIIEERDSNDASDDPY